MTFTVIVQDGKNTQVCCGFKVWDMAVFTNLGLKFQLMGLVIILVVPPQLKEWLDV